MDSSHNLLDDFIKGMAEHWEWLLTVLTIFVWIPLKNAISWVLSVNRRHDYCEQMLEDLIKTNKRIADKLDAIEQEHKAHIENDNKSHMALAELVAQIAAKI